MELAHPLDGLDAHPWVETRHAYGSAEDLPDLLRALAGSDPAAAEEAVSELYGSVLHQGTVYAASVDVAPYLARVAAAGHRTADVLALLGGLAESEDEHAVAPGAVRAAVAAQLPLILPLLDAPDPDVRQAAACAAAHTRDAAALPVLRRRWQEESEPVVRAELLAGLALLDPAGTAATADALARDPAVPAVLRVAALYACLDAGLPWSAGHRTALLSLLPAGSLMDDRLDHRRSEPLSAVVEDLLLRDTDADRDAVVALLDAALRDPRADVRNEAAWAASQAGSMSRHVPSRLLPALMRAVADAASAGEVLTLVAQFGPAAADAAPALATLARRDGHDDADLADRALGVLAVVAPERAAPLLARDLAHSCRGLDGAAGIQAPEDVAFPFDPDLLDAVRARLTDGDLGPTGPYRLTRLLAGWGERAAAALPELYEALPRFPEQAAHAVAAVCPPAERDLAAAVLRPEADKGSPAAARALYDLTGDSGPLLATLERRLGEGRDAAADAARTAAELGPEAASLAPALRAALSDPRDGGTTTPDLDADTAIAVALWRTTGDADTAVRVLDSVLARATGEMWFRWSAIRAARAAALLGPSGRPLVPRLAALLDDPERAPSAILALLAVADPATLDAADLAGIAVRSAESEPLTACEALEALGPAALSPDHVRRLTTLAERDLRVVPSGLESQVGRADDQFRTRLRALLRCAGSDGPTHTG
ncbi:HEAT repeat domain-containing protein [Streptomyces coeruleoprunus]|uniref:HEAT repeat domain-containing protein n=1 Tax=Streptomyces coeruleoprunus TaxID=285563 RepID=A0ABV9X939_9ACTN